MERDTLFNTGWSGMDALPKIILKREIVVVREARLKEWGDQKVRTLY